MVFACFEQVMGMPETTDGGAIPVHGLEFAVIALGEGCDIIKECPGIDARLGFQIPKDDQWF